MVVDPASDWDLFAEKSKELLLEHEVASVFGCWTSVSRKSVLPVFEENGGLLFYPVQYEGEECSRNIIYTGATPNQQLIPAAQYLMSEDGGGYKKFYLLGTDYVFPRTANKILRAYLLDQGVPEANIMEEYTPFHHQDYQTIVQKIKNFAADGTAAVLSTINGDSNVPFYKEFSNLMRVTDDPILWAYTGVYLWKGAVEKAGSFDIEKVRPALYGLTFDSPGGQVMMDERNHHLHKPVYIGEIKKNGQFKIVYESDGLVAPDPWDDITSADKDCDHVNHMGSYRPGRARTGLHHLRHRRGLGAHHGQVSELHRL